MRRKRTRGFTLVEVLIVVVILAILAATIIPQYTNSTNEARSSNAVYNLHVLRSQIELYRAQHADTPPSLANFAAQLTERTNIAGVVAADGEFGPYVQMMPENPFNADDAVVAPAANPPQVEEAAGGWLYDEATGQIWINRLDLLDQ
jgi:type II secretion system protein G